MIESWMTSFRLKHIVLAICLMASLSLGSFAACMCSHHEAKSEQAETSCHGPEQTPVDRVDVPSTDNALDVLCRCFVIQQNAFIKSENKKKSEKETPAVIRTIGISEYLCVHATDSAAPQHEDLFSYHDV